MNKSEEKGKKGGDHFALSLCVLFSQAWESLALELVAWSSTGFQAHRTCAAFPLAQTSRNALSRGVLHQQAKLYSATLH